MTAPESWYRAAALPSKQGGEIAPVDKHGTPAVTVRLSHADLHVLAEALDCYAEAEDWEADVADSLFTRMVDAQEWLEARMDAGAVVHHKSHPTAEPVEVGS